MKLFRIIKSRFSMEKIEFAFIDPITFKDVYFYADCYFNVYLSYNNFKFWKQRTKITIDE